MKRKTVIIMYCCFLSFCSSRTILAEPVFYNDPTHSDLKQLKHDAITSDKILEISPDKTVAVLYNKEESELHSAKSKSVMLETTPAWMSNDVFACAGLRWFDIDDDGDLDLISAHYEGGYPPRPEETRVWYNNNGMLEGTASWTSTDTVWSTDVAVADIDNNTYPDIFVTNKDYEHNVIYFQDSSGIEQTASWSSSETFFCLYASIGDVTGEGYLDIAVVNQGTYVDPDKPNHLYGNTSGTPANSAYWTSSDIAQNMASALGDYDEDGIVQQVISMSGTGTRTAFRLPVVPIHQIVGVTVDSVAVTDYCVHLRDGWIIFQNAPSWGFNNIQVTTETSNDLDLAVAVDHGNAKVYKDTGSTFETTPSFTVNGTGDRREKGVSWVDIDSDGDLDLFVGGRGVPMLLYENNNGVINPDAVWSSADIEPSCSDLDWIDIDNDGDFDLATSHTIASDNALARVYENIGGSLETTPSWDVPWSDVGSMANTCAWGDMNGDGWPDLAIGFAGSEIRVYLNTGQAAVPDLDTIGLLILFTLLSIIMTTRHAFKKANIIK